jgi:tRNA 2-selenouridine synthase
MSIRTVDAEAWNSTGINIPIIDVRSPAEYESGHVPGATNVPLFENTERARVGTLYKQVSRSEAMLEGLRIVGPKMAAFVQHATTLANGMTIGVYCWRGGMRSGSVAQLLDMAGFEVLVLKGGYKGYRRFAADLMAKPWKLHVITGSTGSGKTEILHELRNLGEQVLDLEGLAHHKGSTFGGLMQPIQPSSEHMQNMLAEELRGMDDKRRIWVEDESMNIGSVFLPDTFWTHLHQSPLYIVERSKEVRIQRLSSEYGMADRLLVIERIQRIKKKLGGQSTKDAVAYVENGDVASATEILLRYYDKAYATSIRDRQQFVQHSFQCTDESAIEIAKKLIELSE